MEIESKRRFFVVTFLLLAIRIPFLFTHLIQEDAYITFRTAFHLADYGSFAYNLGEHTTATTSLVYPVFIAFLRLLFGRWTIYAVQLSGSLIVILGAYLVSLTLSQDRRMLYPLWIAGATSTMALYTGYSGMETSFVLLDIAVLIYTIRYPQAPYPFYIAMFCLPFLRPDAIAFGLIFAVALFLISRRSSVLGIISMSIGIASLLLANLLISGKAVPATMRAKEIAYHPSHTPAAILQQAGDIFLFGDCFLVPVPMRPWIGAGPIVCFLFILFVAAAIYCARNQRRILIVLWGIIAAVVLVPAAFAVGGVFFPWYGYPSNWLAQFVLAYAVIQFALTTPNKWRRRIVVTAFSVIWVGLILSQFIHSVRQGTEEFHYRGDVGRFLAEKSAGKGTLFLEPAGYIPFYSGLHTEDEVGLASPHVLDYMRRYPTDWWIQYVQHEHPGYLVQQESFNHFVTYQRYALTLGQIDWFRKALHAAQTLLLQACDLLQKPIRSLSLERSGLFH